jgi:hypothetical protein
MNKRATPMKQEVSKKPPDKLAKTEEPKKVNGGEAAREKESKNVRAIFTA